MYTYKVQDNKLTILQTYINHSKEKMPFYAGFHPYFKTNNKKISYHIPSNKRFDYHDYKWKTDEKFSCNEYPLNEAQVFTDLEQNKASFFHNEIKVGVNLTFGSEFNYLAIWSEREEEYVCVEPWMGLMDEMNRKRELKMLEQGEVRDTFFAIEIQK